MSCGLCSCVDVCAGACTLPARICRFVSPLQPVPPLETQAGAFAGHSLLKRQSGALRAPTPLLLSTSSFVTPGNESCRLRGVDEPNPPAPQGQRVTWAVLWCTCNTRTDKNRYLCEKPSSIRKSVGAAVPNARRAESAPKGKDLPSGFFHFLLFGNRLFSSQAEARDQQTPSEAIP